MPGFTADAEAICVLTLNSERFRGELEVLIKTGKIRIFELPFSVQTRFFDYFYPPDASLEEILSQNQPYKDQQQAYQAFLRDVIKALAQKNGIRAVISSNYMYKQDFDWGLAAKSEGLKYFILYRGGMLTCPGLYDDFVKRYRRLLPFGGDRILVHNAHARQMFLDAGVARADQIACLGSPRMDGFVKRALTAQNDTPSQNRYAISLFSFGHSAGLFGDTLSPAYQEQFDSIWARKKDFGYIRLFHEAHKIFLQVAHENPGHQFVIKTKWQDDWFDKIADIAQEVCSGGLSDIRNLTLSADMNPHDLILSSAAVCSFGSTTLLEAALAGRQVILPFFEEALEEKYAPYVPFASMQALFIVPKSADDYKRALVSTFMKPQTVTPEIQEERNKAFEDFISPLRGNTAELYAKEILS